VFLPSLVRLLVPSLLRGRENWFLVPFLGGVTSKHSFCLYFVVCCGGVVCFGWPLIFSYFIYRICFFLVSLFFLSLGIGDEDEDGCGYDGDGDGDGL